MEASEVQNVCRLCPETGTTQQLLNVFDRKFAETNDMIMKEVIQVTTGIEISETDLVSRKICQRCCNITLKMKQFRDDALRRDKALKEKCNKLLALRGFHIPDADVSVKVELKPEPPETPRKVHPSIETLYKAYPGLKLSKSIVQRDLAPVVSVETSQVEKYFEERQLNMTDFIYKPVNSEVAPQTVSPIKISLTEKERYVCTSLGKRKSSVSSDKAVKVVRESLEKESEAVIVDSDSNDGAAVNVKTKTLLECKVCRTFHNSSFELNRHMTRHLVCNFCKRKFDSLNAKENHLSNSCEVSKIIKSPGTFVSLERVDLNLEIRQKYRKSFPGFPPLAGLALDEDDDAINVIVLSDEEEPDAKVPSPVSSSAKVKPDVRIKCNDILTYLPQSPSEKHLIQAIVSGVMDVAKNRKVTEEKMVQTAHPTNKDIKINSINGSCLFKNLKDQLQTFKIPIEVNYGSFHVAYRFKNRQKTATVSKPKLVNLPLIERRESRALLAPSNSINDNSVTNPPGTSTAMRPPARIITVRPAKNPNVREPTVLNQSLDPSSATPLLQNYVRSIPPTTPRASTPFPRNIINAAVQNRSTVGARTSFPGGAPLQYSIVTSVMPTHSQNTVPHTNNGGFQLIRSDVGRPMTGGPPQNRAPIPQQHNAGVPHGGSAPNVFVPAHHSGRLIEQRRVPMQNRTMNGPFSGGMTPGPHNIAYTNSVPAGPHNFNATQVGGATRGVPTSSQATSLNSADVIISSVVDHMMGVGSHYGGPQNSNLNSVNAMAQISRGAGALGDGGSMATPLQNLQNAFGGGVASPRDNNLATVNPSVNNNGTSGTGAADQPRPMFRVKSVKELQ